MNEVSTKAFNIWLEPLAQRGVALERVVEGTNVSTETFASKNSRIDWADFAGIMRNLAKYFTEDELTEIGRGYMRQPGLRFAFVIGRLLFSPMDFYRWFSKPREGVGNQIFNCIVPHHREIGPNEIELELTVADGHEPVWQFFVVSAGNVEEIPRLFGLPRAKVRITQIERGARYHVWVPTGTPFVSKLWRLLTWPFTARAAARELKAAHETLLERYEELDSARLILDRQATQLRTAHAINNLVQRDIDFARSLEIVARALIDEAHFAEAEIVIDPRLAADLALSRAGTVTSDASLARTIVSRDGAALANLRVVPRPDADLTERTELLDFILPTLALALQNALYSAGLEHLVKVRTHELSVARDALAETVDQLRDAQSARERFFGNISHEIRTPLSLILLATADIESRLGPDVDARTRGGLNSVSDAARKLVRLVDELLLLAAAQEDKLRIKPERADLAALVSQIVDSWLPAAERAKLELTSRIPVSLMTILDPVAIERVVTNLVSNAIKYTPAGGSVAVEVTQTAEDVRVSVSDTGAGFDEELESRLFGRFERTATEGRHKQGTGLGLSLAKQLVEQHGGTLSVKRRHPAGSELVVVLPPAPAQVALESAKTDAPPRRVRNVSSAAWPAALPSGSVLKPPGASQGTIVIAEDDTHLAESIARLLAESYTVVIAHDGVAALEMVKLHRPELLVTDVDMPNMNGIELARRFRETSDDRLAPVIILSAMMDLRTRLQGLDAGAIDYVTKPFDPYELVARVRGQFRMRTLAVRLHRAEQLSSLGILTSGLAHELRNPANGIVNAIDPIKHLLPPELMDEKHPVGQLMGVVQECADQLLFLTRQLLGFRDGASSLDVRQTKLDEIVDRAAALSQRSLGGVELRKAGVKGAEVLCAPPLMTQVFTNLIENAAHAAGKGGWVEVRCSGENGTNTIEVSDSGPGVPSELRERIFEPFFTTKPPGVGTGLGLPLARDIVHRHGGVLEIRERAGHTVFAVEIPRELTDRTRLGNASDRGN